MTQRTEKRRKSRAQFYNPSVDRREAIDRREQPIVASVTAMPGMIRPPVGEQVQVERRKFPESGTE